ncbi:HD domain-containing protein [Diaphorobacter caeni]|uniref:HD domain-containing protein n=1 Tax=Diaphorobacter caeni TaxID=2784387 RepID=UPI00188F3345|nr:HD domain-containing protein [Diaphorobacter caeni]MBF5007721.1 HD domain-containing protein [Diaphorobacter caeni]
MSSSCLVRAIEIAKNAHAGQLDKAGRPYIFHSIRVMRRVRSEFEQMVAVLHDVVEDTSVTLDDLKREGFPPEVVRAIEALTKRPGETRLEAARRAAADPLARTVKLADNADNMDLSRIPNPTAKDYERLREYEQVRAILMAAESN